MRQAAGGRPLRFAFQVQSKKWARSLIVIPAARLWLTLWVEFIKEPATVFQHVTSHPSSSSREVISPACCHHLCWRTSQKRSSWWFDTAASQFNTHSVSSVQPVLGRGRQPSGPLSDDIYPISSSSVSLECALVCICLYLREVFFILRWHYFWSSSDTQDCGVWWRPRPQCLVCVTALTTALP